MSKEGSIEIEGKIIAECASDFIVETDKQVKIYCRPSGKMRQYHINVAIGDKVIVEVSPYDLSRGRIVKRLK
jgi:translation initiation factor IF-1